MRGQKSPPLAAAGGAEAEKQRLRLHPHYSARRCGCQPPASRQTPAQILGPSLLTAVLSGQSTLTGDLVALARRWRAREVQG